MLKERSRCGVGFFDIYFLDCISRTPRTNPCFQYSPNSVPSGRSIKIARSLNKVGGFQLSFFFFDETPIIRVNRRIKSG